MIRYVGIDPSTKTGLVALDSIGQVLESKEITAKGEDPERMSKVIEKIMDEVKPDDVICIEGFGFSTQQGVLLGGIGWGIRMSLYQKGIKYTEAAPTALKKFTGAGGNAPKEQISVAVFKRWGFESKSNNITDAYVLAQIIRHLRDPTLELTKFQQEVLDIIQNPKPKGKKARKKHESN